MMSAQMSAPAAGSESKEVAFKPLSLRALPIEPVGIADFPDAPYHHLRRQLVLRLRSGIAKFVQRELPEGLRLPGSLTDPVATGVGRLHSLEQRGEGVRVGNEFDFGGQLHYTSSIEIKLAESNPAESRRYQPEGFI